MLHTCAEAQYWIPIPVLFLRPHTGRRYLDMEGFWAQAQYLDKFMHPESYCFYRFEVADTTNLISYTVFDCLSLSTPKVQPPHFGIYGLRLLNP